MKAAFLIAREGEDARRYEANLRERGYRVVLVNSIEAAREYVRRNPRAIFDLVSTGGGEQSFEDAQKGILTRDAPVRTVRRRRSPMAA